MHLVVPFASALSEAAVHVLRDLPLPNLARLLARLVPGARDEGDEYSFSPPQERALAAAWGWPTDLPDGCLPFAAHAAAADGVTVANRPWGLITPAHWHVGRDQVSLTDPAALGLAEAESKALFDAVRDLFESEGFTLVWGASDRWYGAHASLAGLPTASLDRVIGRNVDLWVRNRAAAPLQTRLIRRLQSEVQLLLYPHPINEAREARGELAVNTFWLSGCGPLRPADAAGVRLDASLRAPLLADDWAGWAEAWAALDAGALAALAADVAAGAPVALTLCGERSSQRFDDAAAQSVWQRLGRRWQAPAPHAVLEAL